MGRQKKGKALRKLAGRNLRRGLLAPQAAAEVRKALQAYRRLTRTFQLRRQEYRRWVRAGNPPPMGGLQGYLDAA